MTFSLRNRLFDLLPRLWRFEVARKPLRPSKKESPEPVVAQMCQALGVSTDEMLRRSRGKYHICMARFIITHHLHTKLGLSLSETGRVMNRNHATIIWHLKQYDALKFSKDKVFLKMLKIVEND